MPSENIDARGVPANSRLLGKPMANADKSLPVIEYEFLKLRLTSQNIWLAQMAGWCRILTYDYIGEKSRLTPSQKRYRSITKEGVVYKPEFGWRDEYPFVSTIENNGSVFIGHAPAEEQCTQGGIISSFYKKHGADSFFSRTGRSFFFEVRVINHPLGLITRADTTWR
jgi:hypothetical protein